MGLFFILLIGTLFVRPAEIIPDLAAVPIFYILIITCLVFNLGGVLRKLTSEELQTAPVNTFVMLLLPCIVMSHLAAMRTWDARNGATEFGKNVVFYLTLMAVVNTPEKLESLMRWTSRFILLAVIIIVAQYHQWVEIPGMISVYDNDFDPATGETIRVLRICGTGLFSDPNDLSLLLMSGMGLGVYFLVGGRREKPNPFWLLPLALYVYTLTLTHSRGGFLAMMVGMMVLFQSRYGWKKAVPIIMVAVPVAALLFGGRQTSIDVAGGTGQQRIQLWAMGFSELARHPLFGYGYGLYEEITGGLVAHNTFIHAFVELGIPGGIFFTGAYWYIVSNLYKLKAREDEILEPGLRALRPCLLAIMMGSAMGMMTISRTYSMPTYLLLGMGMSYLLIVDREVPGAAPRLDGKCLWGVTKASMIFIIMLYIYTRTGARFGGN